MCMYDVLTAEYDYLANHYCQRYNHSRRSLAGRMFLWYTTSGVLEKVENHWSKETKIIETCRDQRLLGKIDGLKLLRA